MNPSTHQEPVDAFNRLIEAVFNDVRTHATNPWFVWAVAQMTMLKHIWRRLRRMSRKFAAIVARMRADVPQEAVSVVPRVARPAGVRRWIYPTLGLGWVIEAVSAFVWMRHYELEELLEDPKMLALVADAPELAGVLRPLCHMLAVKPPEWLRLPRKPRKSRVKVIPPAPDWLLADPAAIVKPDGTVWMRFGASTKWTKPTPLWETLEIAQKYDRPIKIWPRKE
jgi:hypothetical protein